MTPATPEKLTQARKIFEGLQHGTIDRSLFTDNANFYFNEQALKDFAGSLGPLGSRRNLSKSPGVARGYEAARVRHQISKNRATRLDLRDAGRQAGTIPNRGPGLA